ncbi:RNA binding (RRM/RBD/RNP motifs) family protein [Arabidopsis thaliana]|uniref:RNA binding (RRM/RBD/RNP motifs) family protein n=1 Tax=Arabidopsis thaliana TaxID=3702 RepID=A0A1I9LMT6_ARATH|nr:RNA binding (RRM/RBD/RNP motifs) family protein [Arabidopsis thaliana]ANM63894.1 RNA binding (RRM/RBD/RNP motifs) family protein [Arabidopsis thaliana]|eukprot:NP_001325955.1 RNA binding (RRM/RBD/RNP motifs) family protein [Arabidopsis thaliana]
MGSADLVDDRTFNGDFSVEGVAKLKEMVKDKLKEYMGDYTDDILVEYVIVLLRNGRRKEEANNELKIFLGDDSDSFVAWLWDHLAESVDEYFSSNVEGTTIKSSLISSHEDKALVPLDSEYDKGRSDKSNGARRGRQWRSQPTNVSEIPPLLSSEVHKIHNYEKKDHKHRHNKRSPSPQAQSQRKRSRTDDSRNEQREAKPDVSRRLLQFAVRDALAISRPANSSTESSLKRLRSVVSTSTQNSSDPDPARKIRSVARVVNPMATVMKAVAEAAEDAKKPKSGRSVFDRISHSTGSETLDQNMVLGEVSPKDEESRNFSQDFSSDRGRLGSSVNVSHPSTYLGNRINNPNSLQHRLVDDSKRVKGTNYQNRLPEVATKHKTASFSGNIDTGKTVKLEEQRKIPDVGLQRYMDEGRLVSSEATTQLSTQKILGDTIGNGNVKPAASVKEESTTNKSVPGTLSTTRPLEDASSRTIFVANVHFGATKDSLSRHFNKFGEVLKAFIVTDPATGQPSGSAYIEFTRKEAAENALSLDGTSFMSRILKIVKGSNGQNQEAASSMSWSRGGRFTRAPSYFRGGAVRGRSVVRGGGRSMQWKRDSADTGNNNNVAPNNARSLTYVRAESKSDGVAND